MHRVNERDLNVKSDSSYSIDKLANILERRWMRARLWLLKSPN